MNQEWRKRFEDGETGKSFSALKELLIEIGAKHPELVDVWKMIVEDFIAGELQSQRSTIRKEIEGMKREVDTRPEKVGYTGMDWETNGWNAGLQKVLSLPSLTEDEHTH